MYRLILTGISVGQKQRTEDRGERRAAPCENPHGNIKCLSHASGVMPVAKRAIHIIKDLLGNEKLTDIILDILDKMRGNGNKGGNPQ